jgi:LacI family transcriptional regulator
MAATIHDVARRAGVSIATVSRVLAGNYPVATATRQRVVDAVATLDYSVNPNARRLRGASLGPIAVILGSITGPSFAALAQGVEAEARARGRMCLIGVTGGDHERELEFVGLMRRQRAAAIVVPGGSWHDDSHRDRMARYAQQLAGEGLRLVLCGSRVLDADNQDAIIISYDNEDGAERIARYVAEAGHRRILLLPGNTQGCAAAQRLKGFTRAFAEYSGTELLVRETTFDRGPAHTMALTVLDELAPGGGRPPFTAVLCGTDQMAAGVLEALHERGLRCPDDVSVTGYDDTPLACDLSPRLTTVRVPYERIGALAVSQALDGAPASPTVLPTELMVRSSVAAPAGDRHNSA